MDIGLIDTISLSIIIMTISKHAVKQLYADVQSDNLKR